MLTCTLHNSPLRAPTETSVYDSESSSSMCVFSAWSQGCRSSLLMIVYSKICYAFSKQKYFVESHVKKHFGTPCVTQSPGIICATQNEIVSECHGEEFWDHFKRMLSFHKQCYSYTWRHVSILWCIHRAMQSASLSTSIGRAGGFGKQQFSRFVTGFHISYVSHCGAF